MLAFVDAIQIIDPFIWEGMAANINRRHLTKGQKTMAAAKVLNNATRELAKLVGLIPIWQAMEQLRQEGKVLYVGSSNFAGWHIAQACEEAKGRGIMGLVSEQSLYNLNARMIELEVIPACQSYGLGLIPWSPLAGGLLGGVPKQPVEGRRASSHVKEQFDKHQPRIEVYEKLCAGLGEEPGTARGSLPLHFCSL